MTILLCLLALGWLAVTVQLFRRMLLSTTLQHFIDDVAKPDEPIAALKSAKKVAETVRDQQRAEAKRNADYAAQIAKSLGEKLG